MIAKADDRLLLRESRTAIRKVPVDEYDAVTSKKRRKPPSTILKSEDNILGTADRKRMLNNTRDLQRNAPDAGWAIRKHLDFTSQFNFQARTPDETYNTELEHFVTRVLGEPAAFEIAARHAMNPYFRLAEAGMIVDGDTFNLKLVDGRLQAIEGDRVRTIGRTKDMPQWYNPADFEHGIRFSKPGRAQWYVVTNRAGSSFEFGQLYPARFIIPHGNFTRFDQRRGITPLSSALNSFRDLYEGRVYMLMKFKVAQLFGMVITRSSPEPSGEYNATEVSDDDDDTTKDSAGNDPSKYEIDLGKGPFYQELDDDDDAKFLSNNMGATDIAALDQLVIASALKSIDIPYSFYDESHTNFFGSKQAERLYLFSAIQKRERHREMRNRWLKWRLGIAIAVGDFPLPRGMTFDELFRATDWVAEGLPWWRPMEEVQAAIAGIESGQLSTPEATKQRGRDAYEIARDQVKYDLYVKQIRERAGLPPKPGFGEQNEDFETIQSQERRSGN